MNYRKLGKTGFSISEISLGTWQVGGKWGTRFDRKLAERILRTAIDAGINFIDTADVYSDGESEIAVGKAVKGSRDRVFVATKCGRQVQPHVNSGYQPEVLRNYVEESLKRLGTDCIDLVQLHCPPAEVYYRPEIFHEFEKLKQEGKILNLGVSIEKVEEGIKAMEYENVTSIQVIYNMFRQRPHELLFKLAEEKNVGIIVRVPLASGLLSGKFSLGTTFEKEDHRNFNINGDYFDKGETFAGIPFAKGIDAVEKLKTRFRGGPEFYKIALKWILHRNEVSCIIPGASHPDQVTRNIEAADIKALAAEEREFINEVYRNLIMEEVHQRW